MVEQWAAVFGVVATAVGGFWTAFVYFDKRRSEENRKSGGRSVRAVGGIASGRDTVVHGSVSLSQLPKGAIGLAALGLIALIWAIANAGDKTTTYNLASFSVAEAASANTPSERLILQRSLSAFVRSGDGEVIDASVLELQGEWASQWRRETDTGWFEGSAIASAAGEELRILYSDETGSYDLRAEYIDAGVLLGYYQNLSVEADSSTWVGFVVSENVIRGYYEWGFWDFWRS